MHCPCSVQSLFCFLCFKGRIILNWTVCFGMCFQILTISVGFKARVGVKFLQTMHSECSLELPSHFDCSKYPLARDAQLEPQRKPRFDADTTAVVDECSCSGVLVRVTSSSWCWEENRASEPLAVVFSTRLSRGRFLESTF